MIEGKLVCISGITRGLGRALEMGVRGWRLADQGRDATALQALCGEPLKSGTLAEAEVSMDNQVRQFAQLAAVNLNGIHHLLRHGAPGVIRKKSGLIINLSPGWARDTSPDFGTFCPAKRGIEGLTREQAQDLPSGLATVSLNSGVIKTKRLQKNLRDKIKSFSSPKDWERRAAPFLDRWNSSHHEQALMLAA